MVTGAQKPQKLLRFLNSCISISAHGLYLQLDLEPTRQVLPYARSQGFGNVHDFLVHLVTGGSQIVWVVMRSEVSLLRHCEMVDSYRYQPFQWLARVPRALESCITY